MSAEGSNSPRTRVHAYGELRAATLTITYHEYICIRACVCKQPYRIGKSRIGITTPIIITRQLVTPVPYCSRQGGRWQAGCCFAHVSIGSKGGPLLHITCLHARCLLRAQPSCKANRLAFRSPLASLLLLVGKPWVFPVPEGRLPVIAVQK
jgi:hypothetical protein